MIQFTEDELLKIRDVLNASISAIGKSRLFPASVRALAVMDFEQLKEKVDAATAELRRAGAQKCGISGGVNSDAADECRCNRKKGHLIDSARPHGCTCGAMWAACQKSGCTNISSDPTAEGWHIPDWDGGLRKGHDINRLMLCPEHWAVAEKIGFTL